MTQRGPTKQPALMGANTTAISTADSPRLQIAKVTNLHAWLLCEAMVFECRLSRIIVPRADRLLSTLFY